MQYSLFRFGSSASLLSITVVPVGCEGTSFSELLLYCGEKSMRWRRTLLITLLIKPTSCSSITFSCAIHEDHVCVFRKHVLNHGNRKHKGARPGVDRRHSRRRGVVSGGQQLSDGRSGNQPPSTWACARPRHQIDEAFWGRRRRGMVHRRRGEGVRLRAILPCPRWLLVCEEKFPLTSWTICGAAVAERLDFSPLTKANWVQYGAGTLPDFRKWESYRTMPLVRELSQESPVSPTLTFRRCSTLTSLHPHWLPNLSTQLVDDLMLCESILSSNRRRDWGRIEKESAIAFVRYQIPAFAWTDFGKKHGKPKSGWLAWELNPGRPECEPATLFTTSYLQSQTSLPLVTGRILWLGTPLQLNSLHSTTGLEACRIFIGCHDPLEGSTHPRVTLRERDPRPCHVVCAATSRLIFHFTNKEKKSTSHILSVRREIFPVGGKYFWEVLRIPGEIENTVGGYKSCKLQSITLTAVTLLEQSISDTNKVLASGSERKEPGEEGGYRGTYKRRSREGSERKERRSWELIVPAIPYSRAKERQDQDRRENRSTAANDVVGDSADDWEGGHYSRA
ncbi:hypothetical protein PR048_015194 [Dryococelus australis]|uniref:Uncharacterized protein n=1 Tax=Dryococelus australis TaxID=614101 RepID=A0ABQ9HGA6_9NEOP|nr:hypothetical protein PR048_015194 [Dryococelus australis]